MYEYTKPLSKLRVSGRYSDTGIRFLNSGTAICNQVDFLFDFLLRVYVTYSRPNDLDNVSCFFRLVIIITTKFYVDISTLIRQKRQKTISSPAPELSAFQPVTIDEVRKLLTSTSRKTSPLDVLPVSLLKDCADVFAPAITILANLSLQTARFPARFKSAQVLPLLKKAGLDRLSPANYRPISNLSTVSKVPERLVLARLRPHLTNSANFTKRQSAYRQGHSTEMALVDVLESVYTAADNKEITVLIISTCNYKWWPLCPVSPLCPGLPWIMLTFPDSIFNGYF